MHNNTMFEGRIKGRKEGIIHEWIPMHPKNQSPKHFYHTNHSSYPFSPTLPHLVRSSRLNATVNISVFKLLLFRPFFRTKTFLPSTGYYRTNQSSYRYGNSSHIYQRFLIPSSLQNMTVNISVFELLFCFVQFRASSSYCCKTIRWTTSDHFHRQQCTTNGDLNLQS
jgi:hypothetical protein